MAEKRMLKEKAAKEIVGENSSACRQQKRENIKKQNIEKGKRPRGRPRKTEVKAEGNVAVKGHNEKTQITNVQINEEEQIPLDSRGTKIYELCKSLMDDKLLDKTET